jgi:hypothetical protein
MEADPSSDHQLLHRRGPRIGRRKPGSQNRRQLVLGQVFSEKLTTEADMDYFIQFIPKIEIDDSCHSVDDLAFVLSRTRSAAPGPDGIAYAAWKLHIPDILQTWHRRIQTAWETGRVFAGAEHSITAMIPKVDEKEGKILAQDTRPIALTNTDYKLMMRMVNLRVGEAATDACGQDQAGFVRSRSEAQ